MVVCMFQCWRAGASCGRDVLVVAKGTGGGAQWVGTAAGSRCDEDEGVNMKVQPKMASFYIHVNIMRCMCQFHVGACIYVLTVDARIV